MNAGSYNKQDVHKSLWEAITEQITSARKLLFRISSLETFVAMCSPIGLAAYADKITREIKHKLGVQRIPFLYLKSSTVFTIAK